MVIRNSLQVRKLDFHRTRQKENTGLGNNRLGRGSTQVLHEPIFIQSQGFVKWITTLLCSRLESSRHKSLLKVMRDILHIFQTDTHSDQIGRNTALDLFLVRQLLVSGHPGVDDQGFGIANVGQMAAEFEIVDDGANFVDGASLHAR